MKQRVSTALVMAALLASAFGAAACARRGGAPPSTASDVDQLHDAARQLSGVIVYDIFSPTQASRVYAYASIAAYEAMRPSDTTYRSLAGQVNELTPVPAPPAGEVLSYPLAGVHAFMTVGQALTFSRARMDSLRSAMDARFEGGFRATSTAPPSPTATRWHSTSSPGRGRIASRRRAAGRSTR